jgi:hypothetical protein
MIDNTPTSRQFGVYLLDCDAYTGVIVLAFGRDRLDLLATALYCYVPCKSSDIKLTTHGLIC